MTSRGWYLVNTIAGNHNLQVLSASNRDAHPLDDECQEICPALGVGGKYAENSFIT